MSGSGYQTGSSPSPSVSAAVGCSPSPASAAAANVGPGGLSWGAGVSRRLILSSRRRCEMVHRVQVRSINNDEGNKLLRIVRRSSGSVVTWRRAQMVLLSAQGMPVAKIAEVTFTSPDRVRDVLHNFNADGFESLKPKYAGGRPPKFDLAQRAEIKKIALSKPVDHDLPFSTWSLSKLADFLVAEGVVEDISHEGLRAILRAEGISFPGRQDVQDQH